MQKTVSPKFSVLFLIFIAFCALGFAYLVMKYLPPVSPPPFLSFLWTKKGRRVERIERFSSEEDFKRYLEEAEFRYEALTILGGARARARAIPEAPLLEFEAKGVIPERVSETTVQVIGIDEPDIVKTNGKEIYFSSGRSYYWQRFWEIHPSKISGQIKVIKAFPPGDLKTLTKIDKRGDLLLKEDILVIFSGNEILGYDISDPKSPKEKWNFELESNNFVVGARLYKDKIYLVLQTRIDTSKPCPIQPLSIKGTPLEIKCTDIYHPVVTIPVDVTYTAMTINPVSGKIEEKVSFVGTSSLSVVYMSKEALYITYSFYESIISFFSDFLKKECQDIVPSWVINKLEKLEGYDISDAAKMMEFEIIMQRFQASLSDDERLRIENELENRMEKYFKEHVRDFEITGIVKISLDKFEVSATGNVPGRPLNQFSLDEYQGFLRIATTIGEGFWWYFAPTGESVNDVYVLDKNLNTVGSIQNLGLRERIYSVRFIEDKGYIVTFRQIDPFFVLDLSNPKNPELKGELKIPGYSSYLHPITKDKILGIGKEGSKVKISLFDVADPQNPTEIDKYTLDEYWSDILNTHHAFLLDKKHKIFFLPGSKGGYIFSYKGNQLRLTRAVSGISARRAIYINDYLYIIGENKIVVLNEIDWEKVNELEF
jgi:uncharacterized secreted protein with C-terminal beta-propeller domain